MWLSSNVDNHIKCVYQKCLGQAKTGTTSRYVITNVKQATISNDVITKSETTMWLSQVNQATISDDVITKGETSNHIE